MKSISSLDFTCLLPEELITEKIPRKKSFLFKYNQSKINPNCLKQNEIRKALLEIIPKEMNSIEDSEFGIDYYYKGISIDQKFCFGDLGKDTIKIRVRKKELLNKSDWTMMINENREIIFFKTKKLKNFVRKNWGLVQKNFIEQKRFYSEHYVRIRDLCRTEGVELIRGRMEKEFIKPAMEKLVFETEKEMIEETIFANKTIMNYRTRVCFEPSLVRVAKKFFA